MNRPFYTIYVFAKISVKRYFRDRVALFFTIVFPLIFLLIFGSLYGKADNTSFTVALFDQSHSQFSQQFVSQIKASKLFKIKAGITTLAQADQQMSRGEIDATLVLPANFGTTQNKAYHRADNRIL